MFGFSATIEGTKTFLKSGIIQPNIFIDMNTRDSESGDVSNVPHLVVKEEHVFAVYTRLFPNTGRMPLTALHAHRNC